MLIWLSLLIGIVAILGVAFMRPVATLLGATKEMIDDCVLYGRVVIAFLAPYMLQNVFQSFLIAAEKPNLGLAATLAAGITNIVGRCSAGRCSSLGSFWSSTRNWHKSDDWRLASFYLFYSSK